MKRGFRQAAQVTVTILLMAFIVWGCSGGETTTPPSPPPNQGGGNAGSGGSGGTGGSAGGTQSSPADSYPSKPIQIIVPAGAGGDTDANARTLAKHMEKELGQPLVVNNVGGAGGTTGSRQVLEADPDGYTVLFFHNSMLLNRILGLVDFSYDNFELAGIAVLDQGNTFIVNSESQFQNLNDLVEHAKANPGKVTIATELGGFTHLQLLGFQELTGTELNIVDVGGAADKIKALLGKQVDIVPTSVGLVKGYIESGDFRTLGIMAAERVDLMPDIPTFREQGVDMVFDKFFFFAFPPETPKEIVDKFSQALEKVVTTNEEYKREANGFLVTPTYMGPEEAFEYIKNAEDYYKQLHGQ